MLNLYKETTFQVKPANPASVLSHQVPAHDGSVRRLKYSSQLPVTENRAAFKDETSFAKHYVASQGSIYFRQTKTYPRSFLWRVVDSGRVLELQCADLGRSETEQNEAHLTLRLEFSDPIAPAGIAFADHPESNVLYAFIITTRKELHTLSLPIGAFISVHASEGLFNRWCKTYIPSSFLIDQPHHLCAASPTVLYLSFDSGRLQRLTREESNGGAEWMQDNFDDRSWGASIRGIVSRRTQHAIGFGSRKLSPSTAHAIVTDSNFAYTVCLNHTIRVWSLTTGRVVASRDLLDKARQSHENISLDAHAGSFVRLFTAGLANHPVLLTWTPHEGGQFKFWAIKGDSDGSFMIEDKFPSRTFSPPDPDPSGNTIWSMSGFEVRPGGAQKPSELWVIWRNNNHHQLYSVHFDFGSLPESWEQCWTSTAFEAQPRTSVPDLIRRDSEDPTEKWLEFIFWPDRYPIAVLETALSIYQEAIQSRTSVPSRSKSLQERLCSSVAANVTLRKYGDSEMDYERFVADCDAQWRNYWRIVETINEGRAAPLSLAIDTYTDLPWVIMTDQCCVVRECSQIELLRHNDSNMLDAVETIASERWVHRKIGDKSRECSQRMSAVVKTASNFRSRFPPELRRQAQTALNEELFQDPELPILARVYDFYERCGFAEAISNDIYDLVMKDLEDIGGFKGLSNDLLFAILDTLPENQRGPASFLRYTVFASNILTAGLQDTILLGRQLVFDLFVLVVFLECEINQEEDKSIEFDVAEMIIHLISLMKSYEKKFWLNSHVRLVPLEFPGVELPSNAARSSKGLSMEHGRLVTALYDTLGKAIKPQPTAELPQSFLLTQALEEIESWIGGEDEISFDDGLVYIQCDFLVQNNLNLATDFMQFLPHTPWSTYIRGRLHLARSKHEVAASCFRKAAYSLAHGKAAGSLIDLSAGLLSVMDAECFYNGLPRYYQHILALFEAQKAFDHVADFARQALQSLTTRGTGYNEQETAIKTIKSEILSRLFTAELQCSRFREAYIALAQFTDIMLQTSSLNRLTDAILKSSSVSSTACSLVLLQTLPIGMHPHLSCQLDGHLAVLAKKQSVLSSSGTLSAQDTPRSGPDYLGLLHALRTAQKDYRGAVAVLLDQLTLLKKSGRVRNDPKATELRHSLLVLINALCCVAPDEAYILAGADDEKKLPSVLINGMEREESKGTRRRVIITLDDLRREYSQVLDKCNRIERGDFEFYDNGDGSDDGEEAAFDGDPMEQ